jgi:hypothetical protein
VRRTGSSFRPDHHRRQTQIRLIAGGLLILMIVGGGLVWVIYGFTAAITAVACLVGAALVMGFLWLILRLLESWVREEEP